MMLASFALGELVASNCQGSRDSRGWHRDSSLRGPSGKRRVPRTLEENYASGETFRFRRNALQDARRR